jgi:ribosomal protein L7/L12
MTENLNITSLVEAISKLSSTGMATLAVAIKNNTTLEDQELESLKQQITNMSAQELSDLETAVYSKFNIDPTKLSADTDDDNEGEEAAVVFYEARLQTAGIASKKIVVIQQIKNFTNLSLPEAKAKYDTLTEAEQAGKFVVLKTGITKEEAEKIVADSKWADSGAKLQIAVAPAPAAAA